MATTKIQRQPTAEATRPPSREVRPAPPPHEPMDQNDSARCRAGPSTKAFTRARVAGMMQAADRPCSTRPEYSTSVVASPAWDGVRAISSDPTKLRTSPPTG